MIKNKTNKSLLKQLISKFKEIKNQDIHLVRDTIIRRPTINEKYVTEENYKELIALYELIKTDDALDVKEIETMIEKNAKNFPFLHKCNESIYEFVVELKCNGPYYIAKEMSRQGKEIDYINKHLIKK